jgi:hypothetical protein
MKLRGLQNKQGFLGHKNEMKVFIILNAAYFVHWIIIVFQHNPGGHGCTFSILALVKISVAVVIGLLTGYETVVQHIVMRRCCNVLLWDCVATYCYETVLQRIAMRLCCNVLLWDGGATYCYETVLQRIAMRLCCNVLLWDGGATYCSSKKTRFSATWDTEAALGRLVIAQ